MALAVTISKQGTAGRELEKSGSMAFDSSYVTGGMAVTPASFGLTSLTDMQISPRLGYVFDFDFAANKVIAYQGDNTNAAAAPGIQVPNATNLSTLTGVRFRARGV